MKGEMKDKEKESKHRLKVSALITENPPNHLFPTRVSTNKNHFLFTVFYLVCVLNSSSLLAYSFSAKDNLDNPKNLIGLKHNFILKNSLNQRYQTLFYSYTSPWLPLQDLLLSHSYVVSSWTQL